MAKTKTTKVKENGNLSLADAKVQAAGMSATKKAYVILEGDGCFVAYTPLPGHIHTFYKGVEIKTERVKPLVVKEEMSAIVSAEPKETSKTKTSKTKNEMATKTKTPAKKTATAPKKTAAKKATKENHKPSGKAVMMKRKDIVKGLNAGKRICRASTGRKMNPVYQASLPNQEYEILIVIA